MQFLLFSVLLCICYFSFLNNISRFYSSAAQSYFIISDGISTEVWLRNKILYKTEGYKVEKKIPVF